MKSAITFILATVFAAGAFAKADVGSSLSLENASRLPYVHVADYVSQPGETEQQFLLRVAPEFRAFGKQDGFEACAVIATALEGRMFALIVGTNNSHIACINDPRRIPVGMSWTGETIHIHGDGKTHELNKADRTLISIANPGVRPMGKRSEDPDHFSPEDFQAPGYLVTTDGLIYQHGEGTVTKVSQ